jgi:hypothetical protein
MAYVVIREDLQKTSNFCQGNFVLQNVKLKYCSRAKCSLNFSFDSDNYWANGARNMEHTVIFQHPVALHRSDLGSQNVELYIKTDYKFGTKESSDLQINDYKHDDSKKFCGYISN